MKRLLLIVFALLFFLNSTSNVLAVVDPTSSSNNKFGIHIQNENDLNDATNLVNSNGGDWGYVTFVITETERDHDRWQKVFDQMRLLHLIPIVRLATKPNGSTWDAPQEAEINNWIAFLNNLNWVIQNRYVIINNEPNHADEWGGRLDPGGYAVYLKEFSQKLKSASPDFFVLPAGLDPAAGYTNSTMSEDRFILKMQDSTPDVFNFVDGWVSHAYPNASISIYNHELNLIGKSLPVFVTETGWPNNKYSESQISDNLVNGYKNTWNDPKVIAVTPFILNYPSPPFDVYSWKKKEGTFYDFYNKVRDLPKIKGEPTQLESGQILAAFSQPVMLNGMDFVGAILAKNNGQSIWNSNSITLGNESGDFKLKSLSLNDITPGNLGLVFFRAAATQSANIYTNSIFITNTKGKRITNSFSIESWITTLDLTQLQSYFFKFLKSAGI